MAYEAKGVELPQGLALMLAQDPQVYQRFMGMEETQRAQLIQRARDVQSKNEMRTLISEIQ